MKRKNERHKIRRKNQYENPVTLEDYEKHLLDSMLEIENDILETRYEHRSKFDDRRNEVARLSAMHRNLRHFQLNQ